MVERIRPKIKLDGVAVQFPELRLQPLMCVMLDRLM
jgi:hypothetical protein